MQDTTHAVPFHADMLALLYHEARNVRHLKKARHSGLERYSHLVNLAGNRDKAWSQVQPLRVAAKECSSAREAERVFRRRFEIGLEDLETLYAHSGWKHFKLGGNRWLHIVQSVIQLRQAIEAGDARAAEDLLESIPDMEHNTGKVKDKLVNLDSSLPGWRSSRLW